jgi:hypothetical protein
VPEEYQDHTYVVMSALVQEGSITPANQEKVKYITSGDYAFQTDFAGNGWHKIKFTVSADRQVSFYLDGALVWSPKDKLATTLLKGKNLLLGNMSPGITGKAYHDYVSVSYPFSPEEVTINTDPVTVR